MTKCYPSFLMALLFIAASHSLAAQDFTVTYDFSGVSITSGRTDPTPVPTAPGLTFGSFTAVGPAGTPSNNPNAASRFSFTAWPTGATNGSDAFTGVINTAQYYEVTLTPQQNVSLALQSIAFTIQRSGTGIRQYAVRSSEDNFAANLPATIDPANAALQVVAGDIFQITDATTTATEGSVVTPVGLTGIAGPLTLRFYGFNAEAAGGTFSIDNVKLTGSSTIAAGAPLLTASPEALQFPSTALNTTSQPQSYTISGEALTAPLTVTTAAPFAVSRTANGTYTTSLSVPAAELATSQTIYVRFTPTATGSFTGALTNSSTGATARTVFLAGDGVDPNNLVFDFNACTSLGAPGSGFTTFSVTGAQRWACSNFGLNGSKGVDVNGYSGGALDNEDWLISPSLQIASVALPILRFYSRGEFSGPTLQLLVSTNYDGSSNPNDATWTELPGNFPPLSNVWTLSDGIDLSAYKAAPQLYIAFKYTSSPELGAARWSVDNIDITNRTSLLSVSPLSLNFGEVAAGRNSDALEIAVKANGFGALQVTAPTGYEISSDNAAFSNIANLSAAAAGTGSTLYVRFSPTAKALKVEGVLKFTGTGLDSSIISLTGSSYPKAETFDVGAYNLSFFGSSSTNNPTPQKITTQINNIAAVFRRLNLDIVGVEEVSSDSAMGVLTSALPGYASVLSDRWSYSFDPPDPNFPPQKIGFVYNTSTLKLIDQHVMFVGLFDSLRNGTKTLPGYPEEASHFWSSGRLPFMATFDATIGNVTKRIRFIVLHAKSSSDVGSYNRRKFDVQVLKDSLDLYYPNDPLVIVGDYNDRVIGSINTGATSPYKIFVDDNADYEALTLPLDQAGRVSFISGTGLIDHIIISNELRKDYIAGATDIEDARAYISGYNANTASDHLPVYTRFTLSEDIVLPVTYAQFKGQKQNKTVLLTWTTLTEKENSFFIIERSADGINFSPLTRVTGSGNSSAPLSYRLIDAKPLQGPNYYRLKQTDVNGASTYSDIILVNFGTVKEGTIRVYPNPVSNLFRLNLPSDSELFVARIAGPDGRLVLEANGNVNQINSQVNQSISRWNAGLYFLQLSSAQGKQTIKFVKQ